jgi:hypothetical protein
MDIHVSNGSNGSNGYPLIIHKIHNGYPIFALSRVLSKVTVEPEVQEYLICLKLVKCSKIKLLNVVKCLFDPVCRISIGYPWISNGYPVDVHEKTLSIC